MIINQPISQVWGKKTMVGIYYLNMVILEKNSSKSGE